MPRAVSCQGDVLVAQAAPCDACRTALWHALIAGHLMGRMCHVRDLCHTMPPHPMGPNPTYAMSWRLTSRRVMPCHVADAMAAACRVKPYHAWTATVGGCYQYGFPRRIMFGLLNLVEVLLLHPDTSVARVCHLENKLF